MANPLETLDLCEAKLAVAQRVVAKTRRVAQVVSGVAVAGGFGLLLWKLFKPDEATPAAPLEVPPEEPE